MNGNWQGITQMMSAQVVLAQSPASQTATLAQAAPPSLPAGGFLTGFGFNLGPSILNLIEALVILVIGWIVAAIAASVTRGILNRTSVDNRLAAWITGRQDDRNALPVERWISSTVFWLIIIFTVVAFLQKLQLQAVSQPLNSFLDQIIGFLPKLVGAALLLGVAWALATLSKLVVTRALATFGLDERLHQQVRRTPDERPFLLSETLGNALYWFIFLVFLPSVLNTLGLQGTLQPVQQLLNEILSILPNILAAVLIGAAGWLVAQVVRQIVTNLLAATGTDQLGARLGLARTTSRQSLSWIIGTIVYVLILIPTAIAALNALRIDAISVPAIAMLQQILNALPAIFTAALVLIVAYFLGQLVSDLVTSILTSLGFNNIFSILGLPSTYRRPVPPPDRASEPVYYIDPATEQRPVVQPETTTTAAETPRTPSEIVGIIVWVGIMLFATVAAVNILNIQALTLLVTGIVVILGRILAGLVVFAIGLFLANLAFNIITSSGDAQAQILGQIARIAIIALVSAMALQQIGIASDIVNLAFGLLLGALAVAIALAFGLGSRDIAAQQVRELLDSFKQQRNKPPV
jgi:hypothetical protein